MAKGLFWKDMMVICPHCGSAGTVHFDREKNIALFRCDSCYAK
jgi:transcription elongation factor Elf1